MTLRQIPLAGVALGAVALFAGPALAGSAAANQNEIDALKQQMYDIQQRLTEMQIAQTSQDKNPVTVSLKDGKPSFRTADGNFTMAIRGRAHLDVASYAQDDRSKAATGGGLNSGANFRRAELGVEGAFMKDWGYKLNMQWGDSGAERASTIKDAYLSYDGIKGVSIMAGAIQTPMTLDDTTSSNDITFIERASAANLATSLGAGDGRISFGAKGNTDSFYGSLFYTMNTIATATNASNEGSALVGRAAYAFAPATDMNVHIGASGTFKPDTDGAVTFQDRPELRVDPTRLVSTGALLADDASVYGPELAASYGPFKIQSEYYFYNVNRTGTLPDPDFNSWYAQASWVITGEAYKYDMKDAAYKGVKPANPFSLNGGGMGAWEVAARFSQTDLNYNEGSAGAATPAGGIRGGKQRIITAGVNWYPINNVRFMLEYLDVDVDRMNGAGGDIGHAYNALAARAQFAF